ncbi:hypothetical protein Dhaf_2883 [Desulfitobacterium hafniense DCB-2]|uniref:Uncharacterized protein n=2 Tax=Desulfitobacterium hafniense TaxID=49338 RepID=B8FXI7_DESHD|nr:hypothetical protein Dhaf_2883 [Desulfitobacterium hafniense DCB-2]
MFLVSKHMYGFTKMPERCPLVRDVTLRAKGYRCLIVESYLVLLDYLWQAKL